MQTYQFLPSLSLDEYEALKESIKGKNLIGTREKNPCGFVKIKESSVYQDCYDVFVFDGFSVWEFNRPILSRGIPVLARLIHRKVGDMAWEIVADKSERKIHAN